jgi:general secretion pathway protein A
MLAFAADYQHAAMYTQFFSLNQAPFSIAPDPRYLFMTHGHREALAHLLYGVNSGGGLVLLTGEVGAGKTTVCRYFLEQVPQGCNVAYIFNPKLTVNELLQSICDEFHLRIDAQGASVKTYVDALTGYLLATHAEGQNNVLVIDEAQNLSSDVLEQLRLLTNLETNERKLLQIILIGQPELRAMLDRPDLKQLAQRVIARYHLKALSEQETAGYIRHRLSIAGLKTSPPFQERLAAQIHRLTHGVPRRINLLCDRALLGAYAQDKREVNSAMISRAAAEVFGTEHAAPATRSGLWRYGAAGAAGMAAVAAVAWVSVSDLPKIWSRSNMIGGVHTGTQPGMSGARQAAPVAAASPAPPAIVQPVSAVPAHPPVAEKLSAPATSATTAAILPEQDSPAGAALQDEAQAYRQLAHLWGAALPNKDPCGAAPTFNLHCYASAGGLPELRKLDRPALLVLRDGAGRASHALLTGLSDTGATLRAGDATQTVSLLVLTRYFQGEFATLWRAPASYRNLLTLGDTGAEVDWIAAQLAKLNGAKRPDANQLFDEKMRSQIREFQAAQGLKVDGLVGPVTLMHLNRVAGVDEPRLKSASAAVQAQTTE